LIQSVLVTQQLGFDCGDLRVNHAVTVQLTTASEGKMLYMIWRALSAQLNFQASTLKRAAPLIWFRVLRTSLSDHLSEPFDFFFG